MFSKLSTLVFLCALTACSRPGAGYCRENPGDDWCIQPGAVVELSTDDPALVPMDVALEACGWWADLGITCVAASGDADIAIKGSDDTQFGKALAQAWDDGTIDVYRHMMAGKNRAQMVYTLAHELGHHWGIVDHVPANCASGQANVSTQDGEPLCGQAVMNPEHNPKLTGLTDVDLAAFEMRGGIMFDFD